MEDKSDVSVTVKQLKAAGIDVSKQVPPLLELGEWYLKQAKTSLNGSDFTKANALYNAALVRSRSVKNEIGEDQILRRIVETYREFLYAFAKNDRRISADTIQNEIDSHKKFLADERRIFKERVDKIDSHFNTNSRTDDHYEIHADQMHEVFRDIQDMYIRLVSMLAKECESRLGQPPCNYAIIALGSVARMEATPFSDLEFAILYADPAIGDKINYFRVLTHFLHLKVINLGETILPALGIQQLNDFYSSDPSNRWFYDSETPRGISFDGAMPWASKTPQGRMAMKNKPALELIKTPKEMAELQDEKIAVKEGYHLADVMSRVALVFGDQALVNEYNERVAEKLNRMVTEKNQSSTTVGFVRGMHQMAVALATYHPSFTYLGQHYTVGALFDTKKQFYRLISLLLSDLELIFDLRCPSPWQVISKLQIRGIISASDGVHIKLCLSIANAIRLKTYFANKGQKELLSPVTQYKNTSEQSTDPPIFRYFDEDSLIRLLSISNTVHRHCEMFNLKYIQQNQIDISLLGNLSLDAPSKTTIGTLYYRLQDLPKALEWMKSESTDSLDYPVSLVGQGVIHSEYGEYEKSVKCFENALDLHYRNEKNSNLHELPCLNNLALSLLHVGQYETARITLEKAIKKHDEIYGEGHETITLSRIKQKLGLVHHELGNMDLAITTFKEVQKIHERLNDVPDKDVMQLSLNIASSLTDLDEHTQSLEHVEQALHLSKKLFGRADLSYKLAMIYNSAATVYEHCNRGDKALCWYQQSLGLILTVFGDDPHPGKVSCLNNLGNFFSRRYQTSKAVETLENALKQARKVYHTTPHIIVAVTLNNLGVALKRAEKWDESLLCFKEGKEIMDQILGPNHTHPVTSDILNNMGTIYEDLCLPTEALQCYKGVYKMSSKIYGEDRASDAMATVCSNIACVSEELGDFILAKEYYNKAVEIDKKISSTRNTNLVSSLYGLSSICEVLEQPEESLKHMEEAREVAKNAGSKSVMVASVLRELGMKYNEMGRTEEGKRCFQEAKEIGESLAQKDLSPAVVKLLEKLKTLET